MAIHIKIIIYVLIFVPTLFYLHKNVFVKEGYQKS